MEIDVGNAEKILNTAIELLEGNVPDSSEE